MNIYESAEDYLESMLVLRKSKGYIKSIDIAKDLGVTKPSVSYAVKNLKENGYITMEKSGEIFLTPQGEAIAAKTLEKHCYICSFLKSLGVPGETAHKDACKIEHNVSEETFGAIKKYVSENEIAIEG